MFDYEGSRSEFLKILAEMGEEPAFVNRARASQIALELLLQHCSVHREELLEWPRRHFATLRRLIASKWGRLDHFLTDANVEAVFATLELQLPAIPTAAPSLLTTDRSALKQFIESAERFNSAWLRFLGAGKK